MEEGGFSKKIACFEACDKPCFQSRIDRSAPSPMLAALGFRAAAPPLCAPYSSSRPKSPAAATVYIRYRFHTWQLRCSGRIITGRRCILVPSKNDRRSSFSVLLFLPGPFVLPEYSIPRFRLLRAATADVLVVTSFSDGGDFSPYRLLCLHAKIRAAYRWLCSCG